MTQSCRAFDPTDHSVAARSTATRIQEGKLAGAVHPSLCMCVNVLAYNGGVSESVLQASHTNIRLLRSYAKSCTLQAVCQSRLGVSRQYSTWPGLCLLPMLYNFLSIEAFLGH